MAENRPLFYDSALTRPLVWSNGAPLFWVIVAPPPAPPSYPQVEITRRAPFRARHAEAAVTLDGGAASSALAFASMVARVQPARARAFGVGYALATADVGRRDAASASGAFAVWAGGEASASAEPFSQGEVDLLLALMEADA